MQCIRNQDLLYIILPYFNFCGFMRRKQLFVEFVNRIQNTSGIRIIVAECSGPTPLGKLPGVWKHIKVETDHSLWIKESMINIAVSDLPQNWKYVAWVDADISFLNQNWVGDTIQALDAADIVQMFHSVVNLGPNGEHVKTDKSFGYMACGSGKPYLKNDKYGFWHPGYAWACTRKAFETMGGLVDWAILGSGDRHMAMALIGKVSDSYPGNIHENYKKLLLDYEKQVNKLSLSWVSGTIVHYWHGSLENRKYRERWDILTKNSFDPLKDIGITKKGLLQLSGEGKRLVEPIANYFLERCEDS
jgi:hypothetical protein